MKTISVITPCFNEEKAISECVYIVKKIFDEKLPEYNLEHIICDNCSTDRSVAIVKELIPNHPGLRIIVNSRNFGILKNTYNGVMASNGDSVLLFLPADLQDPPELIPDMVKLWESGSEIVFGIRAKREEFLLIKLIRKLYYRILSRLTYVDYPPDAGDFQLVDRVVVESMRRIDDAQPFMRLMTFDCGFRSIGIKYTTRARKHGKSRNPFSHLFEQGMNGIISFSSAPIRIASIFGGLIALVSFLYAATIIFLKLFGYIDALPGTSTIIAAIFFFGGTQILFTGLIGEYILAIFNQVRRKPLVIERERVNFDN